MIRAAIVLATALLFAAPGFAVDQTAEPSQTPSVEQTVFAQAGATAKPKPKPVKGDTSDYLIITLKDASITDYSL